MRISDWSSDVCSSDLQEPALIVESGRRVFDLYERALVDRDDVAARGVIADRTLHQAVDLGEVGLSQRLLALIERDGDRDAAQPALRRVGDRNLAADLIGAGGILVDRKSTRLNSSH